jgi:hypothetical protein
MPFLWDVMPDGIAEHSKHLNTQYSNCLNVDVSEMGHMILLFIKGRLDPQNLD